MLSMVDLLVPTEPLDYEPPLYYPMLALLESLPNLFCAVPTPVPDKATLTEHEEYYYKCTSACGLHQLLAVTAPRSSANWDNLGSEHMREFAAAQH